MIRKHYRKFLLSLLFLTVLIPSASFARLGVGVGTGKIEVTEKLHPGTIYNIPSITVLNTGDETSEYETGVTYHQDQSELTPSSDWFSFKPQSFTLNPGESQLVEITLNLPLKAEPGNYFCYVEGRPIINDESGATAVGIAAATKLYFEVVPANFVMGIYYKIASFWKIYSPWPQWISIALGIIILLLVLKKFLNIQVNVRR